MERLNRIIPYLAAVSALLTVAIVGYAIREGAPARAMREALEQAAALPQSVDTTSREAVAASLSERARGLHAIDVSATPPEFQAAWGEHAAAVERAKNAIDGGLVTRPEDFGPYVQAMQDAHARLLHVAGR